MFGFAWHSLKFVGIAVPVSLAFLDNIGCVARVHGSSMLPTLQGDYSTRRDYIWLNALAVRNFQVRRGEVVAFTSPTDPSRILIKRVVALEGDIVRTPSYKQPFVRVREGCVWMEGDNRDLSLDSNVFGPVPRGLVLGKATHIIWPPSRWTRLENLVSPERFETIGQKRLEGLVGAGDDGLVIKPLNKNETDPPPTSPFPVA